MIGILLELLQEVRAESEVQAIAKGKYKLPENRKEILNNFKLQWQSRK